MAKTYKTMDELYASEEYEKLGVLGRDRLRLKHFPETASVSGQQGQRRESAGEVIHNDALPGTAEKIGSVSDIQ